jgi:tetratricopeptide (TPR) repeat protein
MYTRKNPERLLSRPCISVFVVMISMMLFGAVQAETPLAVLMSCKGDVSVVKSSGETAKGAFGLQLQAGDVVKTGADAEAEILFEDGNWIQVGAGSSMQVKGSKKKPSDVEEQQSFEVVQNFLKLKEAGGTSSLASLRSGDKPKGIELQSPCQTKIRGTGVSFHWLTSDPSLDLRLTIYDEDGVHWQTDISKGVDSLAYPSDAPTLIPGISYSWTLETTDPLMFPPLRTQAAFFEVLSPDEEQALDGSLPGITKDKKPSEASYHLMRASLFFSHDLIEDAISETKRALEITPDNTSLHAILARLYAEVGRNDAALNEYNHLLESH